MTCKCIFRQRHIVNLSLQRKVSMCMVSLHGWKKHEWFWNMSCGWWLAMSTVCESDYAVITHESHRLRAELHQSCWRECIRQHWPGRWEAWASYYLLKDWIEEKKTTWIYHFKSLTQLPSLTPSPWQWHFCCSVFWWTLLEVVFLLWGLGVSLFKKSHTIWSLWVI